jgi:hypothetical protein
MNYKLFEVVMLGFFLFNTTIYGKIISQYTNNILFGIRSQTIFYTNYFKENNINKDIIIATESYNGVMNIEKNKIIMLWDNNCYYYINFNESEYHSYENGIDHTLRKDILINDDISDCFGSSKMQNIDNKILLLQYKVHTGAIKSNLLELGWRFKDLTINIFYFKLIQNEHIMKLTNIPINKKIECYKNIEKIDLPLNWNLLIKLAIGREFRLNKEIEKASNIFNEIKQIVAHNYQGSLYQEKYIESRADDISYMWLAANQELELLKKRR